MPVKKPKLPAETLLGRFLQQALEKAGLSVVNIAAHYHNNSVAGNHNPTTITKYLADPISAPVSFFTTLADLLKLDDAQRRELILLAANCTVDEAKPPAGDQAEPPQVLTAYLSLMANRSFRENFEYHADLKRSLAKYLVSPESAIPERSLERIYLDGGSTMMYFAEAVVEDFANNHSATGHFVTNNFVTAFYLAYHGIASDVTGGRMDPSSEARVHGRFSPSITVFPDGVDVEFDITTAILSPAISIDRGPLQQSNESRVYIRRLFQAMFPEGRPARRLIMAVDYAKLFPERSEQPQNYGASFSNSDEWQRILQHPMCYVVVAGEPRDTADQLELGNRVEELGKVMGPRLIHLKSTMA